MLKHFTNLVLKKVDNANIFQLHSKLIKPIMANKNNCCNDNHQKIWNYSFNMYSVKKLIPLLPFHEVKGLESRLW